MKRLGWASVAMCAAMVVARVAMAQGASATNVERPKVERPKVERPKVERPEVERPNVERPKVERPKTAASAGGAATSTNTAPVPPISAPIGDPLADVRLVPIDPGTEDVASLWKGGRLMPVDLRTPLNFDQVYRVEGDLSRLGVLGVTRNPERVLYARASGSTIAIFPQSEYVPTREGMFPVIPANTTFLTRSVSVPVTPINTSWMPQDSGKITAASAAQKVHLRANVAVGQEELDAKAPMREPATIWTSEVTRRSRLAALMDQAKKSDATHSDADAERAPVTAAPTSAAPAFDGERASDAPVTPASDR